MSTILTSIYCLSSNLHRVHLLSLRSLFTLSMLLIISVSTHSQTTLSDSLQLCFLFSGNAQDVSGNMHPSATIVGGVSFVPDRFGNPGSAISLDGTGYLEQPYISELDYDNDDPFTISLWVKFMVPQPDSASSDNEILSKWTAGSQGGYPWALRISNQKFTIPGEIIGLVYDGTDAACLNIADVRSTSKSDNLWHHVLFQRTTGKILKLFIDNSLEAEIADTTTCSVQNNSPLRIGTRDGNRFFTGSIDDIRFYNRSLSTEEIGQLFNEPGTHVSMDPWEQSGLTIFPNPAQDQLIIKWPKSNIPSLVTIQILSPFGKITQQHETHSTDQGTSLPLDKLPTGQYFIRINTPEQTYHKKFAITR